jgi:hypothetical protein
VSVGEPVRHGAVLPLDVPARRRSQRRIWAVVVAVGLFALAYENGGYGIRERSIAGVALWWAALLGVGLGLVPLSRFSRRVCLVAGVFGAFALWTLVSAFWAPSAEAAFAEFDRNSLYFALFVVVVSAGGRANVGWWADGLRAGIVAVAVVALISRLFPHVFSVRDISSVLPNASARLSFPVGYWNALAVLAALAVPLSLAAAAASTSSARRALAVAPVPWLVSVIVFASSRGGVLALLIGASVLLAASSARWRTSAVGATAAAGSVVAVVVLRMHRTLLDGPLGSSVAEHQGRIVAAELIAVALATAVVLEGLTRLWRGRAAPSRSIGIVLLAVVSVAVAVALAASDPVRRFDDFRRIPTANQTSPSFATAHLTSGSGSGRWQFWSAAVDEWRSAPLIGRGAGSYQSWWAAHASFTYTLKNAHSLYLETLAELGVVGLFLLLGAFAAGLAGGGRALRRTMGEDRETMAALYAVFPAFAVCAGIDWLWQVPVVTVVGVVSFALVTSAGGDPVDVPTRRGPGWARLAAALGALLLAWAAIAAEVVPWLSQARIADSQADARAGDLRAAAAAAADARSIQPWAASPCLQLALVAEARRDYGAAVRWIHRAADRNVDDWATWYVASRIEREAGNPAAAAAAYERARSLDIRSPLFRSGRRP